MHAPPIPLAADLGKIHYLKQRYGTAEALGTTDAKSMYTRPMTTQAGARGGSEQGLRRTPSAVELDLLLQRRSRARGRGGPHAYVADVVQPKWSVLYRAGSSQSISMKPV